MFISFREAADLSFQIVLAVSVVVGGMAIAAVARGDQTEIHTLDVTRPILWTSAPTRVDRHEDIFTISVKSVASANAADDICSDAIGLRVTCELIVPDRKPG